MQSFFNSLFVILLCYGVTDLEAICPSQIITIAHRGNSSESPENTLASFKESLDLGVDYIEFDVHLSQDDVPVVLHDLSLTRTGKGADIKKVMEMNLKELKQIDVGEWFGSQYSGETIPTLAEVLALPLGKTGLMIEVKEGSAPPEVLAKEVAKPITEYNRSKEGHAVLVGSMSPEILEQLRKELPEGFLIAIAENASDLDRFLKVNPKIVALSRSIATKALINKLSSKNIATWIYTVDDASNMKRFIEMGARGIITNAPKTLLDLKGEYAKTCKNLIDTDTALQKLDTIRQ